MRKTFTAAGGLSSAFHLFTERKEKIYLPPFFFKLIFYFT